MLERPGKSIDWMTFSLFLALVGIGWLMIFTVGYGDDYSKGITHFVLETQAGKQTIWIGICFIVLFFVFLIDRTFWKTFSYPIYVLALLMLIAVLLFGKEIKGARSWFAFGGFTLQPSEFAKFATNLALASFLGVYRVSLKNFKTQLTSIGLFVAPMLLILLQPDAGSALVFAGLLIVLYREGFPPIIYTLGFSLVVLLLLGFIFDPLPLLLVMTHLALLFVLMQFKKGQFFLFLGWTALGVLGFFLFRPERAIGLTAISGGLLVLTGLWQSWQQANFRRLSWLLPSLILGGMIVFLADFTFNNILKPHQQDRINVWLNPSECDPQGSLYNVLQSKMAIGSGGLEGKGFLEGDLTKGNYVPEQSTDFIFCTVGEEQGFIGSFAIIGLFLLLLIRITTIAERQRSSFARCYAYGVAGILFVHFAVNIGMTMGLMPIIGIPLPFISKGGSSLVGFTLMIGVLLKLDSHRDLL